jgi:hypothetical protein
MASTHWNNSTLHYNYSTKSRQNLGSFRDFSVIATKNNAAIIAKSDILFTFETVNRRKFVKQTSLATSAILLSKYTFCLGGPNFRSRLCVFPEKDRKFKSKAVEKVIAEIKQNIGNKEIAWLFEKLSPLIHLILQLISRL